MRYYAIIWLILLAIVAFVLQGNEKIDSKVETEFNYRYQN